MPEALPRFSEVKEDLWIYNPLSLYLLSMQQLQQMGYPVGIDFFYVKSRPRKFVRPGMTVAVNKITRRFNPETEVFPLWGSESVEANMCDPIASTNYMRYHVMFDYPTPEFEEDIDDLFAEGMLNDERAADNTGIKYSHHSLEDHPFGSMFFLFARTRYSGRSF